MLRAVVASAGMLFVCGAHGEIVRYEGSADPVPDKKFVRVVSENDSPVQQTYIKAKDGLYIAAAIRKPKGEGPFPAIIMFHGAPGGRGMEQLVGWSRGDHGGPVWERFLKEGFVVAVADYRGGDYNRMNQPSTDGLVTAVDDGISVINHVAALPYVDSKQVSVYGVSLGGNLVLFLASKVPSLKAVIAGAPAPIWFLGFSVPTDGPRPDYSKMQPDPKIVEANVASIKSPILILVGTEDRLLGIDTLLHDQLVKHGKQVRMEVYEHGYHDFVLGNQGQVRGDLKHGEVLLQGALDALDRSVQFVRNPSKLQ
jgi:dipeptidyl aminopeptidase/acylaminoacyl peptidase